MQAVSRVAAALCCLQNLPGVAANSVEDAGGAQQALTPPPLTTLPQKLWMRGLPELSLIGGPAEGRVVVVTGPTSGIGKETAAALAARGAHGEGGLALC